MSEYKKLVNEYGEPIECDCCQYPASVLLYENVMTEFSNGKKENKYLCEICSSTFLSHSIEYPSQCFDPKLYRTIGWIANFLVEKIDNLKAK